MAVIKAWAGAGLTPGGTITTATAGTGDTVFVAVTGTACTVAADGIRTPCIGVTNGTGLAYGQWSGLGPLSNWSLKFMVKTTTAASGLIIASTSDASSNKVTGFDFTSSGQLRLSTNPGSNVNFHVFPAAFPLGTWTRVEYTEATGGAWTCAYYNGDSGTPIASGSGTKATAQTMAQVRVGRIAAAVASSGLFLDDIVLADSTPLGTPVLTNTEGTPASSALANDRTETVTWPAIAGATGYRALVAPHGTTDYSIAAESVTSPYTFVDLPGGQVRVAIQAKGTA